jgi:ATP-dependent protease HslVU (ClpYQ) peptidase subunit
MTCVVAVKYQGGVLMMADSCGSDGWNSVTRRDQKIYRVGESLIGFTTSYRMGQLLGLNLRLPLKDPKISTFEWMVRDVVPAIRTTLSDGGWLRKEHERLEAGTFLMAVRGEIFMVDSDLQVSDSSHPFDACGSGAQVALGSLYNSAIGLMNAPPYDAAHEFAARALLAASEFCAHVRPPFIEHALEDVEASR